MEKVNIHKRGTCKGTLTRMKNKLTPDYIKECSSQMLSLMEERIRTCFEQRAFALESMEGKRETQSVSMPRKLQVSNVVVKEAKCLYCGASAAA
ncbi:uncharacterized protein LOC119693979 isoform X2 [Plutella xylostella]|uniref:uncharacterized protein LOC119693979 isoform X2 n=1 Tax=Plutella xylostella TaxID=51655 RepID=UPI0005D0B599|nr:uncharacterized protein LOC119693979 isoform X2 [Plutella xylostella]